VAPVPLPAADAAAGDILAALDGQTGRLDLANQRTADVIAVVEACDRRSAAAAGR
jgi:hypothetical protein